MTAPQWISDFTEPNVCVGENLTTDDSGQLRLQDFAIPRIVADVLALAGDGTGKIYPTIELPGKKLIDQQVSWRNDTLLPQTVMMRVIRGPKSWTVSQPNAIEFRDRWTFAVDRTPEEPSTKGIYNSLCGSSVDKGSNSVGEPNPGVQYMWVDVNSADEWYPADLLPGQTFTMWYQCYVWTPPPWSNNANKNDPHHEAFANWAHLQLWAFGQQGSLVTG